LRAGDKPERNKLYTEDNTPSKEHKLLAAENTDIKKAGKPCPLLD